MSTYSFSVKKDKYRLELITTDKELLVEQFELWVRQAGDYNKKLKSKECKELADSQVREEAEITKRNIEAQIKEHEPIKPVETAEPAPAENIDKDLDIFYSPRTDNNESAGLDSELNAESSPSGVFDSILDNSMNNPSTELSFKPSPSIKKDDSYIKFMQEQKIEQKLDYLMLTAYYLTQFEQVPRFTIKQLNSKLMKNLAVIVDHSVLQEAIKRGYIECLPDLTGVIGASEYRLTAYGEKNIMEA